MGRQFTLTLVGCLEIRYLYRCYPFPDLRHRVKLVVKDAIEWEHHWLLQLYFQRCLFCCVIRLAR